MKPGLSSPHPKAGSDGLKGSVLRIPHHEAIEKMGKSGFENRNFRRRRPRRKIRRGLQIFQLGFRKTSPDRIGIFLNYLLIKTFGFFLVAKSRIRSGNIILGDNRKMTFRVFINIGLVFLDGFFIHAVVKEGFRFRVMSEIKTVIRMDAGSKKKGPKNK